MQWTIYSPYLTPYFAQMANLSDRNPEVKKASKEGSFPFC